MDQLPGLAPSLKAQQLDVQMLQRRAVRLAADGVLDEAEETMRQVELDSRAVVRQVRQAYLATQIEDAQAAEMCLYGLRGDVHG
ncbi:hypothetical protein [Metapseudomonas otitidis]|uniref:hypothetical protein n=1 Tax=Metapseudomonas otitidis TaxID=319939 RepID=UPI000D1B8729|nr:hypothetical protein [Pseudomonas otitidis]